MLHLRAGMESVEGTDLLCGASEGAVPVIRRMSKVATFYQSNGWRREPIDKAWLEDGIILRKGVVAMEADKTEFRRVIRGLKTLFKGLQEKGPDRLHQFVRSIEALILPVVGKTQKQFVNRSQTFARPGDETQAVLREVFDMRSGTEHLHPWDKAVRKYPAEEREDVCWQRTRQIERLACDAYSRLLRNSMLRSYFRTDTKIEDFWKLRANQRSAIWGKPLDIALEPLVRDYDQSERAII